MLFEMIETAVARLMLGFDLLEEVKRRKHDGGGAVLRNEGKDLALRDECRERTGSGDGAEVGVDGWAV